MNMEIIKQLAILIVGFALLVKGADLFVDGASGIAKKFGISELIIGLTIVAKRQCLLQRQPKEAPASPSVMSSAATL